jgi:hypothetical protein
MNELNINLLHTPSRNTTRRFLGIIYTVLGILWLAIRIMSKEPESERFPIHLLDIIYMIVFLITGVIFILEGSGISISSWFGVAYIRINGKHIAVKKGVFSKEWLIIWDEVEKIEVSLLKITFSLKGNIKSELNYDNLEYEHIQIIKTSIKELGNEKNIPVTGL